jgi:hypothetical protein
MVSRNRYPSPVFRIVVLVSLFLILTACQSAEETPTPPPTESTIVESDPATPTLAPTQVIEPTEELSEPEPSPTSPVPTPTPPLTQTPEPTPTATATPTPDPTFHTVVSGD